MRTRELQIEFFKLAAEFAERNQAKRALQQKLAEKHIKFDEDALLEIDQNPNGEIFFLERGNARAGYKHVLSHADDFKRKGISVAKLPKFLLFALKQNEQVGVQGANKKTRGRPVYKGTLLGKNTHVEVAITVGNNGFIVGANPTTLKK